MPANRPPRLSFFYKENNGEDITNDEVYFWRRDRCGSHLLLRSVERTSKEKEMNEALTINGTALSAIQISIGPKDSTRKTLTSMPTMRLW